ncbi:dienelactone hydrolase family protein [Nocardia sp. NPDC019395]|uniref:dienelactone hydrolase family protein n=1 Tax=Nocardia sp. NPDC019395 TaxID=3154686 RepID=UPI0033E6D047
MPMIEFPAPRGPLPGYLAVPDSDGPWPAVVVVHDAFGLSDDIRRITDRFAANGYLALAPALFRRGLRIGCVVRTFRSLAEGRGDAIDDLVAARDHLAADRRCTGRVASAGFCMGGGFCLLLAPRGVFDATAPNYGVSPRGIDELRNACPTVASYGARDRMLPGAAEQLEQVLTAGDVPHDVREYPEVGHSFMNNWPTPAPLRVVERTAGLAYSEPEAEDAWRRITAFFDEHLREPSRS